jgi:hypothetical protein
MPLLPPVMAYALPRSLSMQTAPSAIVVTGADRA